MKNNLAINERREKLYLILKIASLACFAIFFAFMMQMGADFGKYSPDYFSAHLITMRHLHSNGDAVRLLQTIPNSASGVLPLWVLGFFDGLETHRLISLFCVIILVFVISIHTKLDNFGFYFCSSILLSPMMISAASWVLPEVMSLLILVFAFALMSSHPTISTFMHVAIPLCRQTFIVILIGRLLSRPLTKSHYIVGSALACVSLGILAFVWGGLVPPNLTGVHETPSAKAPIIALLIFSLYFVQFCAIEAIRRPPCLRRASFALTISLIIIIIGSLQPPLFGGGYIFSRLEQYAPVPAALFEVGLLFLFFYSAPTWLVMTLAMFSISFATTNFMFLKYVDFFIFGFLSYRLTKINDQIFTQFERLAKSVFLFEILSLIISMSYYEWHSH